MRLTFNRLLAFAALAATGLMAGCSTDSPSPTQNKPPGGNGGLSIQLSTTNSTPKAGACTVVQAFATQNGSAVSDGSSVQFTTLGGAFAQNGDVTISIVTQSGAAFVTLCSDSEGVATVKGKITVKNNSAQGSLAIQFIPNGLPSGPFISICANPHAGPVTGNTTVDIKGGGFGTTASAVKVLFKSGGVTHQGVVTNVTDSDIIVITPAFPELVGLGATSVEVDVILPGNTVLVSQNCFTYTSSASFISVCATPGNGPITGGTNVQIQGGGFGTDLAQVTVSFRLGSTTLPAVVTAVTDTSINVITPAFVGLDPSAVNVADIIVKVGAQVTLTSASCFTYTQTGLTPVVSSLLPSSGTKLGGTRVTIFGTGFSSPVQVFFGGVQAEVVSVSFNKIVVVTPPLPAGSPTTLTGVITPVTVKNATCTTGGAPCTSNAVNFTYTVPLEIFSFSPDHGDASSVITIFGQGFLEGAIVTVGGVQAQVVSITGTQILIRPPLGCASSGIICVTLTQNGENACSSASFSGSHPTIAGKQPTPFQGAANATTAISILGTDLFSNGDLSGVTAVNVVGGVVTFVSASEFNGGQTVNLTVLPDCSAPNVTFQLRNKATGCLSDVVSFAVLGGAVVASGPTPATGPAGVATSAVVTGTGLFPTGNPAGVGVAAGTTGGTVLIVGASEAAGVQTVNLSITPTTVSCTPTTFVTFKLKNTGTGCETALLTFTGTGSGITATPDKNSGPQGTQTTVTLTGSGMFPAGNGNLGSGFSITQNPAATVVFLGSSEAGTTQKITLGITPKVDVSGNCAATTVTYSITNLATGCVSSVFTFTGNAPVIVAPAVTTPPSVPAGTTTTGVLVSGSGFFPIGDLTPCADVTITSVPTGAVTCTGSTESAGTQTLQLSITPGSTCSAGGFVTFTITNNISGCVSAPISTTVTGGGITVTQGVTPNIVPSGSVNFAATVKGSGFFRSAPLTPADATVTSLTPGVTVTLNGVPSEAAGLQTIPLHITVPAVCADTTASLRITNTFTGCFVDLTYTIASGGIVVLSGPTPSSIPAGATTSGIQITGNRFSTNTAATLPDATVINVTPGFTVSKTAGTDSLGLQTLTFDITAPVSCTNGSMSFQLRNNATGCVSSIFTLTVTGGIVLHSGPTPPSGSSGVATAVTITASGFDSTAGNNIVVPGSIVPASATVTKTGDVAGPGTDRTLTLTITPADCTSGTVSFLLKNTITGCTLPITYTVNSVPLVVTDGPNPLFGQAGFPNQGVTVTGTGFFPTGDPAQAALVNVTPSGSAVITAATDAAGVQKLTLTITPPTDTSCGQTAVTFQIQNNASKCISNLLSFKGIQAPTVVTGPNPASGPGGVPTDVTLSGFGFFRSGHPADATITVSPSGGTVTVVSATENLALPLSPQTLVVRITPDCLSQFVTFTITNADSTCVSNQIFFNNSTFAGATLTASFNQIPGAPGSHTITFNSTSGPGLACFWTFVGNAILGPLPPNSSSCGPVLVLWDCGGGGPACTTPATATLTVTDACGNSDTEGPDAVSPP
jgi:hypothetical protein